MFRQASAAMNSGLDFSRRDFLKLSASGALGLFLRTMKLDEGVEPGVRQGRSTLSGIEVYREPSFNAAVLSLLGRDQVIEIAEVVRAEPGLANPYNNLWYRLKSGGFAYSGWIQPVETRYQLPVFSIPAGGQLGEITVPLTDTRLAPSLRARRGYRIYYATTHWVTGIKVDRTEKSIWYEVYDNYLRIPLYVRSSDMRLVPEAELRPLSPGVPETLKYIRVDTLTQTVAAFEAEKPLLLARCSSGGKGTRTPPGEFRTFHKGSTIHMANDGEAGAGGGYDLPGVPWVSFFTGTGIAFHGTYWHNNYGRPLSHGCVNLSPADAKFIYLWTRPVIPPDTQYLYKPGEGTLVQVDVS
jgi:lipoprotein-anchoring transpeptidase ErfK/SrfK